MKFYPKTNKKSIEVKWLRRVMRRRKRKEECRKEREDEEKQKIKLIKRMTRRRQGLRSEEKHNN